MKGQLIRPLFAVGVAVAIAFALPARGAGLRVAVTSPTEKARVPWRPCVTGTVSDPAARVFLIIHDKTGGDFFVEPGPISIKSNGTWSALPYIAENKPGVFENFQFEIKAFANPKPALAEGEILAAWPEAEAASELIDVTRHDDAPSGCEEGEAGLRIEHSSASAAAAGPTNQPPIASGRSTIAVEAWDSILRWVIVLGLILFSVMAALPHRAKEWVDWLMRWFVAMARSVWGCFPEAWIWLTAYSKRVWAWCRGRVSENLDLRGYKGDYKGFALHMLQWPILVVLILPAIYTEAMLIRGGLTQIQPASSGEVGAMSSSGLLATIKASTEGSAQPSEPATTSATTGSSSRISSLIRTTQDLWQRDQFLFMALGLAALQAAFGVIVLRGMGEEALRVSFVALLRARPLPVFFFLLLDSAMTLLAANRGFESSPDTVNWAMPTIIAAMIAAVMPWILAYVLHYAMESFSNCWGPLQALLIGMLLLIGGAVAQMAGVVVLLVKPVVWVVAFVCFGLVVILAVCFLLFACAVGEFLRWLFSGLDRWRMLPPQPRTSQLAS